MNVAILLFAVFSSTTLLFMMYDYKILMMEINKCCRGYLLDNKCVLCFFADEVVKVK